MINPYDHVNAANMWKIKLRAKNIFAYLNFKGKTFTAMYARNKNPRIIKTSFIDYPPFFKIEKGAENPHL